MKYKVVRIYEDEDLLKDTNARWLAKQVGVTDVYIGYLKNGQRIATERLYGKIKDVLDSV